METPITQRLVITKKNPAYGKSPLIMWITINTEYTRSKVLHEQDMIQRGWRRNGIEPLIDQEFKSWENLNPELYIDYTALINSTYENCAMWQTVNKRWKEHLAKIIN